MAQVTVSIDGKQYRMACDEGQEEHLMDLAERFDRYVTHLKESFGEIGDQRLTVMAGIMVMDELTELQKRIKGMESEVQTLRKTRDEALLKADKNDAALTGALSALAQRMEDLRQPLPSARLRAKTDRPRNNRPAEPTSLE
jgi:cell division protein ZapA